MRLYRSDPHSHGPRPMCHVKIQAFPAAPPAFSSGESATLRLPLSIINGDALQIHTAERPRGRAVSCLFSIESRWAAWGKWKFGPPAGRFVCGTLRTHQAIVGAVGSALLLYAKQRRRGLPFAVAAECYSPQIAPQGS